MRCFNLWHDGVVCETHTPIRVVIHVADEAFTLVYQEAHDADRSHYYAYDFWRDHVCLMGETFAILS